MGKRKRHTPNVVKVDLEDIVSKKKWSASGSHSELAKGPLSNQTNCPQNPSNTTNTAQPIPSCVPPTPSLIWPMSGSHRRQGQYLLWHQAYRWGEWGGPHTFTFLSSFQCFWWIWWLQPDPLQVWCPDHNIFLEEFTLLEGRMGFNQGKYYFCSNSDTTPPPKAHGVCLTNPLGLYRCQDCLEKLLCCDVCIMKMHKLNPCHYIQVPL